MRMMAGGVVALGTALFLVSFAAVANGMTKSVDLAFTRWLQQFASPQLDAIADYNTLIGQATVDAALVVLWTVVLLLRGHRLGAAAPLAIGATVAIELVGKLLLTHPAPPLEFVRTNFNPLGFHIPTSSAFPSGHIARTTFLAILGAALVGRAWVTAVFAAVAIATPFLRIYIGDHWLSDAVGAIGLGLAVGTLAVTWFRRFSPRA